MKRTAVAVMYFLSLILISAFAMLAVSWYVKSNVDVWLIRQVAPNIVFSFVLAIGVFWPRNIFEARSAVLASKIKPAAFVICVAVGGVLFLVAMMINSVIGVDVPNGAVYGKMSSSNFYPYLVFSLILTGFFQPVLEEVVFRGGIFEVAKKEIGVVFAVVLVSVLFSVFHHSFIFSSFVFSVVMCLVAHRYGLISCIVIHSSYNVCAIARDVF